MELSDTDSVLIDGRNIGPAKPAYIIAEMSANHGGDFDRAVAIMNAAKEAGADAVKLQTYTADTLTIDCDNPRFFIENGPWQGQTMHQLYEAAATPWEWYPDLAKIAQEIGISLFSTPFDVSAVEFLEEMNTPAYKIASYELIELELIECVAATGKPLILSTGEATLAEIDEAVRVARGAGSKEIILLKCTSTYPAPAEQMNLMTIPHLQQSFNVPVGLSDHSVGTSAAIAAVVLGASVIEKHFMLDKDLSTPDSFFSVDPKEFSQMVRDIRQAEKSLGCVSYSGIPLCSRRAIYAVEDILKGDCFSDSNIASRRPGSQSGLVPKLLPLVRGRIALADIEKGDLLDWDSVGAC
jgi:pseudaminic acid synthase